MSRLLAVAVVLLLAWDGALSFGVYRLWTAPPVVVQVPVAVPASAPAATMRDKTDDLLCQDAIKRRQIIEEQMAKPTGLILQRLGDVTDDVLQYCR